MDDLGLSQQDQQVIRPKGQLLEPRLHPGFEHLPVLENSSLHLDTFMQQDFWLVASTILKNMQVRRDDDYSQLNGKIYQMFQTNQRVIVIHYYSRIVSLCVLLEWRIVEPEKSLFSNPYRKSFFPKIHIKFSRILRLLCGFFI